MVAIQIELAWNRRTELMNWFLIQKMRFSMENPHNLSLWMTAIISDQKKFGRWIGAHLFEWFNKYSKEIFTLSDKYIVKFVPNLFRLGKNNRITKWKNNPKTRKREKGRTRQFKRKCDCATEKDGTSGRTKTDLSKSALALYLHII